LPGIGLPLDEVVLLWLPMNTTITPLAWAGLQVNRVARVCGEVTGAERVVSAVPADAPLANIVAALAVGCAGGAIDLECGTHTRLSSPVKDSRSV